MKFKINANNLNEGNLDKCAKNAGKQSRLLISLN